MAMQLRIKSNLLPKVAAGLPIETTTAIHKFLLNVEVHAVAETPVDTGALKNSRQIELEPGKGRIFWGAAHAVPVHEGTARMAARPFAADAFAKCLPGFQDALSDLEGRIT
jgi:hypothetical protein